MVLEKRAVPYDSRYQGGGIARSVVIRTDAGNKLKVRVRDDEYEWVKVGMRIRCASPFGGIERVPPGLVGAGPDGPH